jgi:GntR family transcriptional regulator
VSKARKLGASQSSISACLRRWLAREPPARWLLIEPDPELRAIVIHEMEQALALPVFGCGPNEIAEPGLLNGSLPTVLPSKAAAVRKSLPAGTELVVLQVHPVAPELQDYFQRYFPAHSTDLIGIASRWSEFQRIAQTMLIAVGLPPECLLLRDATRPGWKRGLDATSAVICDSVTAEELPTDCFPITFQLISAASIAEFRALESRFIGPGNAVSFPL